MSSSGKGQSVIRTEEEIPAAWAYSQSGKRGDSAEVIAEAFVKFNSEITLLTVTQKNGETLFCPPIGHRQERGDYQESWQPHRMNEHDYHEACRMAGLVTKSLGGAGIWGVEFFLADDGVYFSELSPRPHDTGMVTLSGSQNFNEFELHARAVLDLPIPEIKLEFAAASAVILAADDNPNQPVYSGFTEAASLPDTDFRIFGKPFTRKYRRMGVAWCRGEKHASVNLLREKARMVASCITING
jgi:phosphoribosylglycinamide formyltransferase 2